MFKFIYLPVIISTIINSSLFFFPSAVNAQDYPLCFIVTLSGQVVDLDNLCQSKSQDQTPQKAKACQEPFDKNGFPIAFSRELKSLTVAVAAANKRNVYATDAMEVQSAMAAIIKQMPFSEHTQNLYQEQKKLFKELRATNNSEVAKSLQKKLIANTKELGQDLCFIQLMNALHDKFDRQFLY
jgi:hypothetical protein